MTLLALALLVAAAFMHATWNLLAKRVGGGPPFVWLFATCSTLIYAPLVLLVLVVQQPRLGPAQFLFMGGSAVLHLSYFLTLQQGYRVGDLSLVYPLARGTGPTLATIGAIVILGERPGPIPLAGAALVVVSVFLITGGFAALRQSSAAARPAIALGLLTGLFISSYSLWDKHAVSALAVPPLLLDWSTSLFRTVTLFPVARRRWCDVQRIWGTYRLETLGIGVLSTLAYLLVLFALSFTPVSRIAPAREMSILVGTFFGARILSEGQARRRLASASLMVAGVIALALG
ncbi:MAG TPA: hypothetical protein VFI42_08310 [Thermomicrobiaceae bacterium]|nr:hypothetical protein [Thermomicrobiaceae bacterium]